MEEIWKDIKGYEGLYQVSNLGRIKSLTRKNVLKERIIKGGIQKNGYRFVLLYKDKKVRIFKVHRLVAEAFIPNPNEYKEINHIDENKQNNNAENLEWCTRSYNCSYGSFNKNKVRKVLQYDEYWNFIKEWDSITEAHKVLKISHSSIVENCKNRRNSAGGYIWEYKK